MSPIRPLSIEYFRKNPTPITRISTPMRSSQLLAMAYSRETPSGSWSSPTMIQFHVFRKISLAAVSKRLGSRGAASGRVQTGWIGFSSKRGVGAPAGARRRPARQLSNDFCRQDRFLRLAGGSGRGHRGQPGLFRAPGDLLQKLLRSARLPLKAIQTARQVLVTALLVAQEGNQHPQDQKRQRGDGHGDDHDQGKVRPHDTPLLQMLPREDCQGGGDADGPRGNDRDSGGTWPPSPTTQA